MRRRKYILPLLVMTFALPSCGDSSKASITGWDIPSTFTAEAKQQGKVQRITYHTKDYVYGTGNEEDKQCAVYLPYGYDASHQYNIIYLLHGTDPQSVDHLTTWFDLIGIKNVLDNMIEKGECEPLIVCCPTFYSYGLYGDDNIKSIFEYSEVKARSNQNFLFEMRNDLIPAVESTYSTFAIGTSVEELSRTRHHRAMAGLSNGCRLTMQVGIVGCLDLFSYYGCYSSSIATKDIENAMDEGRTKGYGIDYCFNADGIYDMAYHKHMALYKELVKDGYLDNKNSSYQEIAFGWHSNRTWGIAFYDTLQLFFKER